jgi:filamentous hemagglutinin
VAVPVGDHTLALHVGLSDSQLLARLAAQPQISGASTFTNRAVAEAATTDVLDANAATIGQWLGSGGKQLVLSGRASGPIGRYVAQGSTTALDVSGVNVVLRADPSMTTGYRILTSYPTP